LGLKGPRQEYEGLVALDVSERFGFWVHGEYINRFSGLVPGGEPRARPYPPT
jgi:hypothetical protein